MNPYKESQDSVDSQTEIQFDDYSIKYRRLKDHEAEDDEPKSWGDVWEGVQHHLRRICVHTPGAVADGLSTVRSVLKGIAGFSKGASQVPAAIVTRIRRGHAIVEAIEDQRQQELIDKQLPYKPTSSPSLAPDRLKEKLEDLRRQGFFADLIEQEDGSFLIVIKRPDDPDAE